MFGAKNSFSFDGSGETGYYPMGHVPGNVPAGWKFHNIDRLSFVTAGVTNLLGASGTLRIQQIWLPPGEDFTKIGFGMSAGGTVTQNWGCVLGTELALLAKTSDYGATPGGTGIANNIATYNLTAKWTSPYVGPYYIAYNAVFTVQPTFFTLSGNFNAAPPLLCGNSSTGLTTAAAFTGPALAFTAGAQSMYVLIG
jgi:hypothetical protein